MEDDLFSEPFVAAWRRELEGSSPYREASSSWRGSIVLMLREDGGGRAVLLDLDGGRVRAARPATGEDLEDAGHVLAADAEVWRRLLEGRLDPIFGLISGQLRLERGSLATLTAHARAARELVRAARRAHTDGAGQRDAEPVGGPAYPPPKREERPFRSTMGLDRSMLPMRLWERAKELGVWNPSQIDFRQDRRDWRRLKADERDVLLRLSALFLGGEEAVTRDLLPLLRVMAEEGRLEEEMYLTSFLWEEAKHVDAFRRFLDEVAEEDGDLGRYHGACYRRIFQRELPGALARLDADSSPAAQAEASVTYNMIVEGVLAETGYHAYHAVLERHGILPGMLAVVGHLRSDEARHLAYGVFLLTRLVAEHGEVVWKAIEARMGVLLEPALGVIDEIFTAYEEMPFGLERREFTDFASTQFERRLERIRKGRSQSLEEVLRAPGIGSDGRTR